MTHFADLVNAAGPYKAGVREGKQAAFHWHTLPQQPLSGGQRSPLCEYWGLVAALTWFPLCVYSPVKFVAGDCWPRGPALAGCPSLLAPGGSSEQPMEVSTAELMDTSGSGGSSSEASAPLPIRHPAGLSSGPYKKQAYPMNSKRPEHLRMNL